MTTRMILGVRPDENGNCVVTFGYEKGFYVDKKGKAHGGSTKRTSQKTYNVNYQQFQKLGYDAFKNSVELA